MLPEGLAGNGRYEILRRLGAGANGVVYEARDRERQARVALKSLTKLDASTLYRFKREFRVLADVTHPNLVRLHDLVSERDEWFFTMELVEGTEFLDYVCGSPRRFAEGSTELARTVASPRTGSSAVPEDKRRSSRPPASGGAVDHERLRAGLRQLAAGVEALHAAGQLHRDLKPSNVLVTHQGRVVIVDFGISKDLRDRANDVTGADVVVGTPLFMAPEQAAGRELTAAADWYAVGVMLYMALTGRAPIDGGVMDVLTAKMTRVPAPPGAVVAGVPDDLNDLCVRLLAIAPAERATGADILRVLTPSSRPAATSIPESSGLVSGEFPASQEAFVGRHEVLSRLSDAFAQVERGESALAFLQGTSGMGKSAIARHFLDQLPGRAVVLAGRCFERESVPYKAFDSVIDALTRHLLHLRSAEQGELVPRDVAALVRLFPVLDRVPAIANAPRRGGAASDPQQIRKKAFVALRELFGRLGDRSPVVVFIDDLQWGDEDSAALLRELIAPPEPPRMLLLLAFRREDLAINAALASLVDPRLGLAAGRDAAVVMVDALAPAETRRLARALLGGDPDESLVERIESESGGNPFFVRELVQFVQSTSFAPTRELRLQTVLRERFDALDAGALRLLRIAAVAGRPIAQGIAFRAADLEDDARSAALAALRGGSLARAQGTRADDHIECSHDRIREAVVASLDGDALRSCHAELVRAMTEAGSADDEALLLHSHAAGMLDRACAHALAAARKAALALAFDRAAQFQRIALELMPNDDVRAAPLRVELGDALANAGRGVEAADAYLACTATASAADRLALKRRAAEELLFSGRIDRGLEVISEVLAHFGARFAREPSGDHSAVSSLPGAAVS